MISLSEALNKTIKKVGDDKPRMKLKKCAKCDHWYNPKGQSGVNHKIYCTGK